MHLDGGIAQPDGPFSVDHAEQRPHSLRPLAEASRLRHLLQHVACHRTIPNRAHKMMARVYQNGTECAAERGRMSPWGVRRVQTEARGTREVRPGPLHSPAVAAPLPNCHDALGARGAPLGLHDGGAPTGPGPQDGMPASGLIKLQAGVRLGFHHPGDAAG